MAHELIKGLSQAARRPMHFARGAILVTMLAVASMGLPVRGEPAPREYEVPFLKGKHGVLFAPEPILSAVAPAKEEGLHVCGG